MKRTALMKAASKTRRPRKDKMFEVRAKSQIVEFEADKYLNVDLWYDGELKARYFASKKEMKHEAYLNEGWSQAGIDNVARICKGEDILRGDNWCYFYEKEFEYDTEKDKKIVGEFLGENIYLFETECAQIKRDKAFDRKLKRIDEKMTHIPPLPEEVYKWVNEEIYPEDYLFFENTEKGAKVQTTCCGAKAWKKKKWKHGERGICPFCGKPVRAEKTRTEIVQEKTITVLQPVDEMTWVERMFRTKCEWKGKKTIRYDEKIRTIIKRGDNWGKCYYGLHDWAGEFEQEFYDKKTRNQRFMNSYLYPGNLEEVLPYGGLEHSGLDVLAKRKEKINVNEVIIDYDKKPYLEYLIKAGLIRLAVDVINDYCYCSPNCINFKGKNLKELLYLDGNRVNRLKMMNGGIEVLHWLQLEQTRGLKISQNTLERLRKNKIKAYQCEDLLAFTKSVERIANYIKKQKEGVSTTITTWKDYLRMAYQEGYDCTDDIVLFPKELQRRHDELVEAIVSRQKKEQREKEKALHKELNVKIAEHLKKIENFRYEDENYIITPARTCEDLIEEGRTLHHCVGSVPTYMQDMAAGTGWILFLRKKTNPFKPYYTIEIDTKSFKIRQFYSTYDRQPNKEKIEKVLKKFTRMLKRKETAANEDQSDVTKEIA